MEELDDHGLNLSLTLKSPPNHHHHLNSPLPPPPPPPPPPSQCRPFELLDQMFPYILTRAHNNLYDLLPPGYSLRRPPTNYKSPSDDEMDKEIVASIEEKRRKAAEEMEEREWERRQERKLQRRQEVEEEVVAVSSPNSTVSTTSLSGNKRGEREENSEAEKDLSSEYIVISEDEEGGDAAASVAARKKLMLSKDKASVLEETFKEHNWLSTKQKVELGKQLDLRPRQVEVWFQNRRARTKLKQTEVNFDYLKTCCEVIGEENRRLKKELIELRAFKHSHQSNMDMFPPTTFVTCPQCTRVTTPTSSSSTQASSVAGATNTNHQNPADPNHPKKSTSGIPFAKLISSEALNVPRRLP